ARQLPSGEGRSAGLDGGVRLARRDPARLTRPPPASTDLAPARTSPRRHENGTNVHAYLAHPSAPPRLLPGRDPGGPAEPTRRRPPRAPREPARRHVLERAAPVTGSRCAAPRACNRPNGDRR